MTIYKYTMGVCINDRHVHHLDLYVRVSEESEEDFTDDLNGNGPTAEFERLLARKIKELEAKMEEALGCTPGAMEGLLSYTFPIEGESDEDYEGKVEPDYVYM